GRPRLAEVREDRPVARAPGGSRSAHRRPVQGQARTRLEAGRELRTTRRADGEGRPRPPAGAARSRLQGPRHLMANPGRKSGGCALGANTPGLASGVAKPPMRILITGITGFV